MYQDSPLSDLTYPLFAKILMYHSAASIVTISTLTEELVKGATYFFILGFIALVASVSFSTAWHLMEIENVYGSERKMESAYYNHVRCRNASIILFFFAFIMAFLRI